MLLCAKHLQGALAASFILNADFVAQCIKANTTVARQPEHAFFIGCVTAGSAIAPHFIDPLPLEQGSIGPYGQWWVFGKHPLDRLERHARSGPGAGVAVRYLRSDARRGGQECVSSSSTRWAP